MQKSLARGFGPGAPKPQATRGWHRLPAKKTGAGKARASAVWPWCRPRARAHWRKVNTAFDRGCRRRRPHTSPPPRPSPPSFHKKVIAGASAGCAVTDSSATTRQGIKSTIAPAGNVREKARPRPTTAIRHKAERLYPRCVHGPLWGDAAGIELLRPTTEHMLQGWPISKRVNSCNAPAPTLISKIGI